jgi:hypothetical protein
MKIKKILFYLLAGLLGSCVPVMSLHPLFTEEKLVFENKLLGTWMDDPNSPKSTWEFKRIEDSKQKDGELNPPKKPEKAYKLILLNNEDNTKGSFYAHLVKLENRLFLDVYPSRIPCAEPDPNEDWLLNTFFLIPSHSFVIIDSIEPQLKMRWTNQEELKKLLKEEPGAVKHELVEDGIILTALPEQLQQFVLKYADDERVFSEETTLTRSKTTTK